jgi:hypothetical protein
VEQGASSPDPPPRRRRRAVGPPGARVAERVDDALLPGQQAAEQVGPDDDAWLLADVPPHHGS